MAAASDTIRLVTDGAAATFAPASGGRLASLVVDGSELIGGTDDPGIPDSIRSGSFAMAPWAGRLRGAGFSFRDNTIRVPADLGPNAIHGLGHDVGWQVVGDSSLELDLAGRWPLGGMLRQDAALYPGLLRLTLTATATTRALPVTLGFHPWFRRMLDRGGPAGIDLPASEQYALDDAGLPDGSRMPPVPGPWDDCFVVPSRVVTITWPGALVLRVGSSHDHFVVYDRAETGICVEPQTGPPDSFHLPGCPVLEPGESASLTMELRWQLLDSSEETNE